jgi:ubiquinone/menaquinone biosynthesis C-methylase UbiE
MIIYGLMKYIEKIPVRYDKVMNVLTLGNHSKAHQIMLDEAKEGMEILDIGCGTGKFALAAATKGARVTCVDASTEMLRLLNNNLDKQPELKDKVTVYECGAASIERKLGEKRFDLVTASLMLGELPPPVRSKTIKGAANLLKADGTFIVCDEFWPDSTFGSLFYHLLFWIFFIPNFILTRTLIQPVQGFAADAIAAELKQKKRVDLLGGAISILWMASRE